MEGRRHPLSHLSRQGPRNTTADMAQETQQLLASEMRCLVQQEPADRQKA